ncbi:MAG: hypothetical protein SFY80_02280 [Verrucomicrobiota bacterium]|nr:hypothetical protein [Verrucomicrobiota bacterium]
MKIFALIFAIPALLLSGCVAPGSSVGRVGLKAQLDKPYTAAMELRAVLTKEYGLGGLDRHFGKPEDYGNRDIVKVAPLTNEKFQIEFPRLVYHIDFWMLPPLGALPRQPPPPMFWIELSDSPDEVYQVGFVKHQFKYRVWDRSSRLEKSASEAKWLLFDGRYAPESFPEEDKVWYLEFRIQKQNTENEPNKAVEPTPVSVTIPAEQDVAPLTSVTHL